MLYLNGQIEEHNGCISLHLRLTKKELSAFDTIFNLGLLSKRKDFISDDLKRSGREWEDGLGFGFHNFLHHDVLFLPDNEYLSEGNLTFFCNVR